jgi:hypothetical protein
VAPARRRAFSLTGNLARSFQIGQQSANPLATHAGTRAFDAIKAEVAQFVPNGLFMSFSSVLVCHLEVL